MFSLSNATPITFSSDDLAAYCRVAHNTLRNVQRLRTSMLCRRLPARYTRATLAGLTIIEGIAKHQVNAAEDNLRHV